MEVVLEGLVGDDVALDVEEVVGCFEEAGVGGEDVFIGSDEDGSGDVLEVGEEGGGVEGWFWGCFGGVSCSEVDFYEESEKEENQYGKKG